MKASLVRRGVSAVCVKIKASIQFKRNSELEIHNFAISKSSMSLKATNVIAGCERQRNARNRDEPRVPTL